MSAVEDTTTDVKVDESPISPVDRRNSLEKHLQHRPDAQDLKNRHILLDTNAAPALQAKQVELERHQASDNLRKHLERRPDREELVDTPALQASQKSLEKHMRADSLEQKIQRRPTAEQLVQEGILEEGEQPAK